MVTLERLGQVKTTKASIEFDLGGAYDPWHNMNGLYLEELLMPIYQNIDEGIASIWWIS